MDSGARRATPSAIFLLWALILWFSPAVLFVGSMAAASDSEVVATGMDGFCVTTAQVEEMKKFLQEHTPFEASQKDIQRHTVCSFLMAREAERLNLSLPSDFKPLAPIHTTLARARLYMDQVLENYVLDPLVVESYYKAHFEEFTNRGNMSSTTGAQENSAPWNAAAKMIHERLMQLKEKDLAAAQCRELKRRYGVQGRGAND